MKEKGYLSTWIQRSKLKITSIEQFIITAGSKLLHKTVIRYCWKRGLGHGMHSLINCYFIWERLCRINLQHFYAWQSQLGEIRCRSVWIRKSENVWGTQRLPRRAGFLEQVEKTGERVQEQGREAGRSLSKETAVRVQGV